jgi:hypothetical protein
LPVFPAHHLSYYLGRRRKIGATEIGPDWVISPCDSSSIELDPGLQEGFAAKPDRRNRFPNVTIDRDSLAELLESHPYQPGLRSAEPAKKHTNPPIAERRAPYVSEKRQFVINLLKEIFPGGIPPKDKLPDTALCRHVIKSEAFAAKEPSLSISRETILRAAGRRLK